MNVNINFIYIKNKLKIEAQRSEYMKDIFKNYISKSGLDIQNVSFTIDEKKINGELKLEQINNTDDNLIIYVNDNNPQDNNLNNNVNKANNNTVNNVDNFKIVGIVDNVNNVNNVNNANIVNNVNFGTNDMNNNIKNNVYINFIYNGKPLLILGNRNDYMKDILLKYCTKSGLDLQQVCFEYKGRDISIESKLSDINTNEDKMDIEVLPNRNNNVTINFLYEGCIIQIQCNTIDYMIEIFKKFAFKSNVNLQQIYFSYNGNQINPKLRLGQIINTQDKNININVIKTQTGNAQIYEEMPIIEEGQKLKLNKFQEILCPVCNGNCLLDINDDFKIKLSQCNNSHERSNISLKEFNDYAFNEKDSKKDFLCDLHSEKNVFYCKDCHKNICDLCANEHDDTHNLIYLKSLLDNQKISKSFRNMITKMDIFKNEIQNIINKLKFVQNNIELYSNICNNLINEYDNRNKNYKTMINLNTLYNFNKKIEENIDNIINENKIKNKIKYLIEFYEKIEPDKNLIIKYKVNLNDEKVRIFGDEFVNKNKNNCKIIFGNKELELDSFFDLKQNNVNNEILEISLRKINDITDMSYMFEGCSSLESIPNLSRWNTDDVINMSYMFSKCSSLKNLSDISKLNTKYVQDMSYMFNDCSSIEKLPDISNWNTRNVTTMKGMFNSCSSLAELPDISKWDTTNLKDLSYMFSKCSSLKSLPDISKWNSDNFNNLENIFDGCSSLAKIPTISVWNTKNVTTMASMFNDCKQLTNIPDISKWDMSNVTNISNMFNNCNVLAEIPDISIWKFDNLTHMKNLFTNCFSIKHYYDISKWNTEKVVDNDE